MGKGVVEIYQKTIYKTSPFFKRTLDFVSEKDTE
jgi:hypothetical protein